MHGVTTMGFPWVLDKWHDPHGRLSVQVHLPSGNDVHKTTGVRVSTDQEHLVLTFPMSQYLRSPENAFNSYLLVTLNDRDREDELERLLELHPKSIGRMRAVGKICERNLSKEIVYEQRIPLPRPVHHMFTSVDVDPLFYGKKFVRYPDDSTHLHVELLCESGDRYDLVEEEPAIVDAQNAVTPSSRFPIPTVNVPVATCPAYMEQGLKISPSNPPPPVSLHY